MNTLTIQFIREYSQRDTSENKVPLVDTLLAMALKSRDTTLVDGSLRDVLIPEIHEKDIVINKERGVILRVTEIQRDGPRVRLVRFNVSAPVSTESSGRIKSSGHTDIGSIHDLMSHLRTMQVAHEKQTQRDMLGGQFYFDQKHRITDMTDLRGNPHRDDPRMARIYELSKAPKHLSFCKVPFSSNKRFNNLFGDEIRRIENKIQHFTNNEQWYSEKGIPHQLGICLHGPPGTGKTSVIGAIANMTKRHIVNVHCGEIQTHTQLRRLFYEEDLHVYTNDDMTDIVKVKIPVDQRLYVLEELDAIPSTLSRKTGAPKESVMNEITLAHWLQIMDDVNQISGRILVVTSNYPERLDAALMRPGRIDLNIHLGNASRGTIADMIQHFTDKTVNADALQCLPDGTLPPALVSNVIQQYMDLPVETIVSKIAETPIPLVESPTLPEDNPASVMASYLASTTGTKVHCRDDMSGIHSLFK